MSTSVVQTRCTLLQALLDDLLTQPPLCFQPEVCIFFSKDTPDPTGMLAKVEADRAENPVLPPSS